MGSVELPVILIGAGLVTLGVVVFSLGHRQVVHTTPLVQVVPSYQADISQVQNMINTANVISGRRDSAPVTPSS